MDNEIMGSHFIIFRNRFAQNFEFPPARGCDIQLFLKLTNQCPFWLLARLNMPAKHIPDVWVKVSVR
jgi:hypothetical protein